MGISSSPEGNCGIMPHLCPRYGTGLKWPSPSPDTPHASCVPIAHELPPCGPPGLPMSCIPSTQEPGETTHPRGGTRPPGLRIQEAKVRARAGAVRNSPPQPCGIAGRAHKHWFTSMTPSAAARRRAGRCRGCRYPAGRVPRECALAARKPHGGCAYLLRNAPASPGGRPPKSRDGTPARSGWRAVCATRRARVTIS